MSLILRNLPALRNLNFCIHGARFLNSNIPAKPVPHIAEESLPTRTSIDDKNIELLERLSLVKFGNKEGIKTVEEAVRFADRILTVDTKDVEPMVTVLENCTLYLRQDKVTEGNIKNDILANASVTDEDYFVAPPGNIPMTPSKKY